MAVNKHGLINDPFKTSIKWDKSNKKPETNVKSDHRKPKSRSRSRSRSPRRRRSRSISRTRSPRRNNRHESPRRNKSPKKYDARQRISENFREDRHRAQRTISNVNRIKGLEKILSHRDEEILELKRTVERKEKKYQEMKIRANSCKRQMVCGAMPCYGQPFAQPQMAALAFSNFSMPRSISNETVKSQWSWFILSFFYCLLQKSSLIGLQVRGWLAFSRSIC